MKEPRQQIAWRRAMWKAILEQSRCSSNVFQSRIALRGRVRPANSQISAVQVAFIKREDSCVEGYRPGRVFRGAGLADSDLPGARYGP